MLTDEQKTFIKHDVMEFTRAHITDYINKTDIILKDGSHLDMLEFNRYLLMIEHTILTNNRRNYKDIVNFSKLMQSTGLRMEDSPDLYPDYIREFFYELIKLMRAGVSPFSEQAMDAVMLFIMFNCNDYSE